MKFMDWFKAFIRKQIFIPSRFAILFNSNYIVSRGTSTGIRKHSGYMKGKMLDFGCGTKPYRSLFKVDQHIGVDIVNQAHTNDISRIDKFYDGKTIPFGDGYFDSLFSSEVLTHIFNIDEVMKELNRVLKKGGHFLLTVPFVWKENEKPNDSVRYTEHGIQDLLEKSGFEIIVKEKRGNYLLVIFQLFSDYIYSALPRIKLIRLLFTLIVIFPVNLTGILLCYLLPDNRDLYINNIVVARKR
ncbi:MAG: class I SAM-dependent methyltransferase [Bacteroidetes bacterium]|nr:MAG: class I SAM-dependent methyltransferase [Bacteroidota bacterium]